MNSNQMLIYFLCCIFINSAAAIEDKCLNFYGFQDKYDMPKQIQYANNGWVLDETNHSYKSGLMQQSSLLIVYEGPTDISFNYKTSTTENGIGVFQFLIDGVQQPIKKKAEWSPISLSVAGNGRHEFKWIVYKGEKPFTAWIDLLCIKETTCSKNCTTIDMQNQLPAIRDTNIDESEKTTNLEFESNESDANNSLVNTNLVENNESIYLFIDKDNIKEDQMISVGSVLNQTTRNLTENVVSEDIEIESEKAEVDIFVDKSKNLLNQTPDIAILPSNESESNYNRIKESAKEYAKLKLNEIAINITENIIEIEATNATTNAMSDDINQSLKQTVERAINEDTDIIIREVVEEEYRKATCILPDSVEGTIDSLVGDSLKQVIECEIKGEVINEIKKSNETLIEEAIMIAAKNEGKNAAIDAAKRIVDNTAKKTTTDIVDKMAIDIAEEVAKIPIENAFKETVEKLLNNKYRQLLQKEFEEILRADLKQAMGDPVRKAINEFRQKTALNTAKMVFRKVAESTVKMISLRSAKKLVNKFIQKVSKKVLKIAIPFVGMIFIVDDLTDLWDLLSYVSNSECIWS